jgi:hypothetical protein
LAARAFPAPEVDGDGAIFGVAGSTVQDPDNLPVVPGIGRPAKEYLAVAIGIAFFCSIAVRAHPNSPRIVQRH